VGRQARCAKNRRCNVVLKLEDVFERAIKVVSPEMGGGGRIKQLRSNADADSGNAQ